MFYGSRMPPYLNLGHASSGSNAVSSPPLSVSMYTFDMHVLSCANNKVTPHPVCAVESNNHVFASTVVVAYLCPLPGKRRNSCMLHLKVGLWKKKDFWFLAVLKVEQCYLGHKRYHPEWQVGSRNKQPTLVNTYYLLLLRLLVCC